MLQVINGPAEQQLQLKEQETHVSQREKSLNRATQGILTTLGATIQESTGINGLKRSGNIVCLSNDNEEQEETESDQKVATISRTILLPSGATYMGEMKNGKFNGRGWLTLKETHYKGIFENNHLKMGLILQADGTTIVGTFVDKKLNGLGEIKRVDGIRLKGIFANGVLEKGEIAFPNGTTMKGYFKNEKLNGAGMVTYKNGRVVVGRFVDNIAHGEVQMKNCDGTLFVGNKDGIGRLTKKNGYTYVGQFINAMPHGEGHLIGPDKKEIAVTADNGKITKK